MKLFASRGYFLFLRPKFFPRYAGLKDPDPCSSVGLKRPSFILMQNNRSYYSSVHFTLQISQYDTGRQKIQTIQSNFLLNAKFQYHSWSLCLVSRCFSLPLHSRAALI